MTYVARRGKTIRTKSRSKNRTNRKSSTPVKRKVSGRPNDNINRPIDNMIDIDSTAKRNNQVRINMQNYRAAKKKNEEQYEGQKE